MNVKKAVAPLFCLLSLFSVAACAAENPPNVVFILADDMGWGDVSCYNSESKIPTPAIDHLAAQGMRFTDAHAPGSTCAPSRYGILTGNNYYFRYAEPIRQKNAICKDPVLLKEMTLPRVLKRAGYHTAAIGKWHFGVEHRNKTGGWQLLSRKEVLRDVAKTIDFTKPARKTPLDVGFDYFYGIPIHHQVGTSYYMENRLAAGTNVRFVRKPSHAFPNAAYKTPATVIEDGWDDKQVIPQLTRRAVEYVEQRAKAKTPFFLYYPMTAPHTPQTPNKAFIGSSQAGLYGDFTCETDWSVGQVLKALDDNGVADNTLVIFSSDNGSHADRGKVAEKSIPEKLIGHDHLPNGPWRGIKGDIWEGGHRVPMIVRWPGVVAAGSISDATVTLCDLQATFAAMTKTELPATVGIDSTNVLPVFKSKGLAPRVLLHGVAHARAIRYGDWKLIPGNLGSGGFTQPVRVRPKPNGPQGQLYNLKDDPSEKNNLYQQQPERVAELLQLYHDAVSNSTGSRLRK